MKSSRWNKTWPGVTVRWLLAATALLLSCNPYLCEEEVKEPEPVVLSGSSQLHVTCASGEELLLSTHIGFHPSFNHNRSGSVAVWLHPEGEESGVGPYLYIYIPKELEDGSYSMATASPIRVDDLRGKLAQLRGTLTFQRSRNLPLIDVREPGEDEVTSTLLLSLELQGAYEHAKDCGTGTFAVGPVTINLERSSTLSTCHGDPFSYGH